MTVGGRRFRCCPLLAAVRCCYGCRRGSSSSRRAASAAAKKSSEPASEPSFLSSLISLHFIVELHRPASFLRSPITRSRSSTHDEHEYLRTRGRKTGHSEQGRRGRLFNHDCRRPYLWEVITLLHALSLPSLTDHIIVRDPSCSIRIKVPAVSRQHAAIRITEQGQVRLRDLI